MAIDYNNDRAKAALRNAQTRAADHASKGNTEQAYRTLRDGTKTVLSWLDGSHPKAKSA